MGWTCTDKPLNVKAYLDRNHTWESENASHKVIRSAFVGLTYYAAVETIQKADGKRDVWGAVTLIRYSRGPYGFCVKELSEDMGPCESNCPRTILDLLTPTPHESAIAWRARCLKNAENKSAQVDPAKLKQWAIANGAWNWDGYSPQMRARWARAYRKHFPIHA